MLQGGDMIANLSHLPNVEINGQIKIKRAFVGDKEEIISFIKENFPGRWAAEAEHALMAEVSKCFVATENGQLLGFACYDAAARGFFGPIGVLRERRGESIGQALLVRTLEAMREYGYAYAVIGWVDSAAPFYQKSIGAAFIPDGSPENSVYANMLCL